MLVFLVSTIDSIGQLNIDQSLVFDLFKLVYQQVLETLNEWLQLLIVLSVLSVEFKLPTDYPREQFNGSDFPIDLLQLIHNLIR